jgi:serine/threonine protein kinase
MLGLAFRAQRMAKDRDRVPVSTEIPDPSSRLHSDRSEDQLAHGFSAGPVPPEFSAASDKLAVGQTLGGRYRIERELGEGGMGVVYLARDEQVPGETFAVKVLKESLDPQARALLREEVRKSRKLSHPNIVDVHSVNVDGTRLYVLMEYLEGKSLHTLLDEEFGRGMSFSHAWPIIEDAAAALSYAHDHNVIHSDLKPANIFLTTSGKTKLLDFGIARVSRGPLLRKRSGPLVLTPAYASCEMLKGEEADRRDDIYSFACVIYEMLCGERPFGELTALEARQAGARVPVLQRLSREQNAALGRALAFERAARTASVEKLVEGLAAEHPRRGRPMVLIGAIALAVVAAAGLTYLALNQLWVSRHSLVVEAAPVATAPIGASLNALLSSIAVLPFVNISGDKEQDYFSDGLCEELIDHIVHSADLRVISRTSSSQFKGKNEDVRSIARKLGVTHVLEGSVRKDGQQLRITAQLIRASDGVHLWSQTYDRNLVDIFKVQEDIGNEVSQALHVALRNGRQTGSPEPDIRAYNLVLEGNYFKARRTPRDVEKAIQLYQQAIAISPGYALAWARLASAYLSQEILRGPPSASQNRDVLDALGRALQLDPNLAWAYYTRAGYEMSIAWNWAAAKTATQRVQEIDPRFALLPSALADLALAFGDVDRALELDQEDLARNPLDPNALDSFASALCAANRLQECLQTRLRLLHLHPEFGGANSSVGLAHLYLDNFPAALQAMLKESNEDYRLAGLSLVYSATGRREQSNAALHSLSDRFQLADAYGIAAVHAYRGEIDESFRWLEQAYQGHEYGMLGIKTDPLLRKLHSDPRFRALLSRMRLLD